MSSYCHLRRNEIFFGIQNERGVRFESMEALWVAIKHWEEGEGERKYMGTVAFPGFTYETVNRNGKVITSEQVKRRRGVIYLYLNV